MKDKLQELDAMIEAQTRSGNWDYDPYMHGMANGMIAARAFLTGVEPEFLEAPEEWISESKQPVKVGTTITAGD